MVEFWVISHLAYALVTTEHRHELVTVREDSRRVFLYILVCCSVFSFGCQLHIAFLFSCCIAIFYVFCDYMRKIAAIFLNKNTYWPMFFVMNMLIVVTVIYIYLILNTYG
jgi:hypothetical protein